MCESMKRTVRMILGAGIVMAVVVLATQPAQAQTSRAPTPPSCNIPSSVRDDNSTTTPNLEVAATTIEAEALSPNLSGEITAAREVDYFQIIVPDLVVGELSVKVEAHASNDPDLSRSVARLCQGGNPIATHPNTATGAGEGEDEAHANIMMQKVKPGTYYVVVRGQDVNAGGTRLGSGDTHPTGHYTLEFTFDGVYPTTAGTSAAGSLTIRGDRRSHALTTSIDGLLTVKTTGATDTKGAFVGSGNDTAVDADTGGSGRNFQIIAPVEDGPKTVYVEGQTPTVTGDYTLDVDFDVAETLTWASTITDSDGNDIKSGEADYFFFNVPADRDTLPTRGFMTIQTEKHSSITSGAGTSTRGTLYGPKGLITTDDNSGAGGNFKLSAPVSPGNYVVKVEGQASGPYTLKISTSSATSVAPGADAEAVPVAAPTDNNIPHAKYYQIAVTTAGTLQVLTTGNVDTVGELYGPDGRLIATDEDSGKETNFKITRYVTSGNYIVVVRAANRTTVGSYTLKTGFIEGVEVDQPTTPTDPTDPTPPTVTPDPTGSLDEPANGGIRSGIGLVRGWVCQDAGNGVEIRIMNADGTRVATFTAPYGSARGDVDESVRCGRTSRRANAPIGFAAQFNYNLLAAGTYTIQAWVGREQVGLSSGGQTNTFRVVRISNQEFLTRVRSGRIRVEGFPFTGDTTILEWDQQSQNFQIVDTE